MEGESPRPRRRWAIAAIAAVAGAASVATALALSPSPAPRQTSDPAVDRRWAARTGVPENTELTQIRGDLDITTAGTVVDALDVHGRVIVRAPDVTIRNSIIRGAAGGTRGGLVDAMAGAENLTIVDSEIFAATPSPNVNGVQGSHFTLLRVDIHTVIDQVHVTGDDVTVSASWLHDNLHYQNDPNHGGGPSHDDNVQVQAGRGIRILDSRLSGAHNAVVQITQDRGPVGDLVFDGNSATGGACSINVSEGDRGPIRGLVIRDSVFGRGMRIGGCAIIAPETTRVRLSGTTFEDGEDVTVRKGA